MIVLDASAAVAMLLNLGASAASIQERMNRVDEETHVPHVFELEVLSVLRRHTLSGILSEKRSAEAIEDLTSMRINRYPHTALLSRIWELKDNVTTYDAAYIALAETLEAPLVTRDAKLARAPGIRAAIEVYE